METAVKHEKVNIFKSIHVHKNIYLNKIKIQYIRTQIYNDDISYYVLRTRIIPTGIIQNLLYYSKTRTSVDEVVYDMEVGQLMRDALNAVVLPYLIPGRQHGDDLSKWLVNEKMKNILAITRKGFKRKIY